MSFLAHLLNLTLLLGEPSSLFDFEEVLNNNHNQEPPPQNNNGPPPMVRPNGQAPRTMEELNSIHSFDDMMRKFLSKYFPPSMVTKLRNEITKFEQKPHESLFEAWERYKLSIDRCPNHSMLLVTQIDTFYNGLTLSNRDTINAAAGGTFMQKTPEECYELIKNMTVHHNHWDTLAIRDETSRNISSTSITESPKVVRQLEIMNKNFLEMMRQFQKVKTVDTKCMGSLLSNTVPNPREDLKAITTRSGVTLVGPSVSPPPPLPSKDVDQETETITDHVLTESTNNVPPPVVQPSPASTSSTPISFPKMPEVTKDTAVIIKKLPEKLGDPGKFLIPCDFPELDECLALADLGASINLMPLSNWRKLSLPELTSTQMILELVDRSTTRQAGIAEDVFVKVGKFHFLTDFVVVDYVIDPRVPLILGRPFLRAERALIDVYGQELTLHINDEAITFKVGQASKYSYKDAESINQIDVIDVAYDEYVQEVLGFFDNSKSGSPTPTSDPIISSSSPSFTPFEGSDFILEEIKTFLQTLDELSNLDDDYYDAEGDILYLEKLLNEDPYPNLPPVKTEDLKQVDATMTKPSIEEPSKLKLKELPSYLEYACLERTDKLPVIISKELKDEEKSALLKISINPQDQEKTTFTCPYGTFSYRRMPFGLCNAPGTFQRCMMAIFHDMIEKMMEVFMDDFSFFVLSKTIVYTDHSALKYLLAKQDAKPRFLWWILLHQEFDVIIRDKKGAKNLAADHLSRLENPYQDELEKKEITETFPLETLGMLAFRGDSSTSWFANIANYHAGNFIVKGMSSQQKKKFFKDVKHYF
nr:reverse transcriptase domain-containing protein [Tanacetum cinerariifolium]